MRDNGVSLTHKLQSIGIGLALTLALVLLEVPLETVVGIVAPGVGAATSFLFDGAEAVVCPLLIAALCLPHLAPARVTVEAPARSTKR